MNHITTIDRRAKVRSLLESVNDDTDRRLLQLMLAGETKFEVYAETLNIRHLETREQQLRVKQNKDRLLKRLQRDARR